MKSIIGITLGVGIIIIVIFISLAYPSDGYKQFDQEFIFSKNMLDENYTKTEISKYLSLPRIGDIDWDTWDISPGEKLAISPTADKAMIIFFDSNSCLEGRRILYNHGVK